MKRLPANAADLAVIAALATASLWSAPFCSAAAALPSGTPVAPFAPATASHPEVAPTTPTAATNAAPATDSPQERDSTGPAPSTSDTLEFEADYTLRRTLQGSALTHDRARVPDIEFSVWRTFGRNTLALSSDVELVKTTRPSRILESTFFASRSFQTRNVRIEPGLYLYLRNRSFGRSTGEAALSVGRRTGTVRWFADGFLDVLHSRGDYLVQGGFSHRFSLGDNALIRTKLLVGRSSERVDSDFGRISQTSNYVTLGASLTRDLSSHLSLAPHIEATRFLSGDTHTFFKFGLALEWDN